MTESSGIDAEVTPICPSCGASLAPDDRFCESCGTEISGADDGSLDARGDATADAAVRSGTGDGAGDGPATGVVRAPGAVAAPCQQCGGSIDDDGFCSNCGARGRTLRDHWTETPASWVGGVCDIGERHARNEDAMSVWVDGTSTDRRAVLVVCDGVTTAPHSDRASLAAAADATHHMAEVLTATRARSVAAAIESATDALVAGCRVAQVAVLGVTRDLGNPTDGPSCTFAAAIVDGGVLAAGWCGDSRVYWMPDHGSPRQVSVDHSLASVMIAAGASRRDAESDPTAHTITRWLGADSFEPVADTTTIALDDSGWVVVCSDGLWNYASEAEMIRELLQAAVAGGAVGPTEVAESLAGAANLRGGHDNVTVLLARLEAEDLARVGDGSDSGAVDEAIGATIGHSDESDESVERGG